jgi:hypothetical protein
MEVGCVTDVAEEPTASIIRAEVRSVECVCVYVGAGDDHSISDNGRKDKLRNVENLFRTYTANRLIKIHSV